VPVRALKESGSVLKMSETRETIMKCRSNE